MKGVILAGGTGSRLFPITEQLNKHLLPVYDKPLIYYPISNLLLAGCKEILIISSPESIVEIENLLGNGKSFGLDISYKEQLSPDGIPSAIHLAKEFAAGESIWVSLGDNLIFGSRINELYNSVNLLENATIFIKHVGNIKGFGAAKLSENKILSLEEKPKIDSSGWAVTGLYKFPNSIFDKIPNLKTSKRGETEVIDLINIYLSENQLDYKIFGRGVTWVDCGTVDDLKLADNFVYNYQKINNTLICSPEEISYNLKLISKELILKNISKKLNSDYYINLRKAIE